MLGKKERGAFRLTLVQAFNSLGAFLAPLFASGLFMRIAGLTLESRHNMSPDELIHATIKYVQLPYLGLGAILFLLALFVGFSKFPQLSAETAEPLPKAGEGRQKYIFQFSHVILGGLAIFAYVGAEVTIGRFLASVSARELVTINIAAFYWGGALAGRFIGAGLLKSISPRKLIGINAAISALLVLTFILLPSENGNVYFILAVVGLFNSILFPCIFALGIDGLGRFSEEGSSILIMSIVGGAIIPMVWGNLSDVSLSAAFGLIIVCYLYVSYFGFKGSRYEKRTNFY
jgi:FHS family L-fucose permease-like MFS transporter